MREGESAQRSEFQFELFKLNLIANGALIAFALNNDDWSRALLACPFISFILFSLWFHHALAIRLDAARMTETHYHNAEALAQRVRRWSFFVAMVANFVGVPIAAVLIYRIDGYSWLSFAAGGLLVLTIAMFGFWFFLEYYRDGKPVASAKAPKAKG